MACFLIQPPRSPSQHLFVYVSADEERADCWLADEEPESLCVKKYKGAKEEAHRTEEEEEAIRNTEDCVPYTAQGQSCVWDENQFVNELQVARSVWTRGSGEREEKGLDREKRPPACKASVPCRGSWIPRGGYRKQWKDFKWKSGLIVFCFREITFIKVGRWG